MRFRYQTDGAVAESGFRVDNIAIGGTPSARPRPPTGGVDLRRLLAGRRAAESQFFFNAYVAENRQYDGYDTSLRTAYNFSYPITKPDWVEHYPYQNGLLVSYWNDEFAGQQRRGPPRRRTVLPVDAHPAFCTGPTTP